MRFPMLGGLFKEFMNWSILRDSLLDTDERPDLKLMEERKAKERDTEKVEKWGEKIGNIFFKAHYVKTRNLFAHGKELLIPMPLTHLLQQTDMHYQSMASSLKSGGILPSQQ